MILDFISVIYNCPYIILVIFCSIVRLQAHRFPRDRMRGLGIKVGSDEEFTEVMRMAECGCRKQGVECRWRGQTRECGDSL